MNPIQISWLLLATALWACVQDAPLRDPQTSDGPFPDARQDARVADQRPDGPADVAFPDLAIHDVPPPDAAPIPLDARPDGPPLDADPDGPLPDANPDLPLFDMASDGPPPDLPIDAAPDRPTPDAVVPDAEPPCVDDELVLRPVGLPEHGWIREGSAIFEAVRACGDPRDGELEAQTMPLAAVAIDGRQVTVTPDADAVYTVSGTLDGIELADGRFGYDTTAPTIVATHPYLDAENDPPDASIYALAEQVSLDIVASDGLSGVASLTATVAVDAMGPELFLERLAEADGWPRVGAEQIVIDHPLEVVPGPVARYVALVVASDVAGNETRLQGVYYRMDLAFGLGQLTRRVADDVSRVFWDGRRILVPRRAGLATYFGTAMLQVCPLLDGLDPAVAERVGRLIWSDIVLAGVDLVALGRVGFAAQALADDLQRLLDIAAALSAAVDAEDWLQVCDLAERGAFIHGLIREGWHLDWRQPLNAPTIQAEIVVQADMLGAALIYLRLLPDEAGNPGGGAPGVTALLSPLHDFFRQLQGGGFAAGHRPDGVTDDEYMRAAMALPLVRAALVEDEERGVFAREVAWLTYLIEWWLYRSLAGTAQIVGAGGQAWPIYVACQALVDGAEPFFDARDLDGLHAHFEGPRLRCSCLGVYNCDLLVDEGPADRDQPMEPLDECQDVLYRPDEWAGIPDVMGRPARCQLRPEVD